jgi:hypothetical protein
MVGKTFCQIYTWPSPLTRQVFDRLGPVGGFNGRLPVSVSCWNNNFFYRVLGTAQCEATVSVEVFVVESYLDCFLDEAVHVS